jgi:protein-S-isoprenylcysteine O-methyltransferase Ste14
VSYNAPGNRVKKGAKTNMKDTLKDNAGVIAPPPLIYAATLVLSLILHQRIPLPLIPRKIRWLLGAPLIAGATIPALFALRGMRKVGTNVNPEQPTTALVLEGPYRFTRNPIYLSMTLLYASIAVLANTLWPILLLPGVLFVMTRGVIEREEAYLERKFGQQYLTYKENVRRWL